MKRIGTGFNLLQCIGMDLISWDAWISYVYTMKKE